MTRRGFFSMMGLAAVGAAGSVVHSYYTKKELPEKLDERYLPEVRSFERFNLPEVMEACQGIRYTRPLELRCGSKVWWRLLGELGASGYSPKTVSGEERVLMFHMTKLPNKVLVSAHPDTIASNMLVVVEHRIDELKVHRVMIFEDIPGDKERSGR